MQMPFQKCFVALVIFGAGCHSLPAHEAATAKVGVDGGREWQVTGLPAFAPSRGLFLIQDPPDAIGVSQCVEICALDASSGAITTQWSRRSSEGTVVPLAPMSELQALVQQTGFETLEPLLPKHANEAVRHFVGAGLSVDFEPGSQQASIRSADGRTRTISLPSIPLACDDDPETGKKNVSRVSSASDLLAWGHARSGTLLVRATYLGNDQSCTRATWLLERL
jgi:hypothetical protein